MSEPIVVFTCDTDWAPAAQVKELLDFFELHHVPLTLFVTDMSRVVEGFLDRHPFGVGPHFNFMVGSTQGHSEDEILSSLPRFRLPGYRNHCFYDNTKLQLKMRRLGFTFDSNSCLWLQHNLCPLRLVTDIVRFPVWFEDDWALRAGMNMSADSLELAKVTARLLSPGLKVLNFHPHYLREMRVLLARLMYYVDWGVVRPVSLYETFLKFGDGLCDS